jgi:hypothetical protein
MHRAHMVMRSAANANTLEEHPFMYNDDHKPPRKASRKGKDTFRKNGAPKDAEKKRRGRDGERWQEAWHDSFRIR